jgi:type 1 glutamine amidotransferase
MTCLAVRRISRHVFAIIGAIVCALALPPHVAHAEGTPRQIVLIGGTKSHGPREHDFPNGIRRLERLLKSAENIPARSRLQVAAYPDGWPKEPGALENAATIVWYFDGLENHPLLDASVHAQMSRLMRSEVGLVAFHQAFTVRPQDEALLLPRWLGGARYGMVDRTTESVEFTPLHHPISSGVGTFTYQDEFYPTIRFLDSNVVTPILVGKLSGKPVERPVAWAFEREGGGRSFAFTGLHYLAALDQPDLRKLLLNAIVWTAGIEVPREGVRSANDADTRGTHDSPAFHRDSQRTGWYSAESKLSPRTVSEKTFGLIWESPVLDGIQGAEPHLYASPLYVDRVKLTAAPHQGRTFSLLFSATSTGFVYAIHAFKQHGVAPGTILWKTQLAGACASSSYPPIGVLSTPVIDPTRNTLYVTHCSDAVDHFSFVYKVYALDIRTGEVLRGWPLTLNRAAVTQAGINQNAPPADAKSPPYTGPGLGLQRAALNLSPDGQWLYVAFGESTPGWLIAIDTTRAKVASSFASVANPRGRVGGIWGAGGPAVDTDGSVFVVTGTTFNGYVDQPNDWSQSALKFRHAPDGAFALAGTYTPFNYCQTAHLDIDLGSGGALLVPTLSTTSQWRLMAFGGKQGNLYLVNRAKLPGHLNKRQPCSEDPASDLSLLPPAARGSSKRSPLNVFGPYSEKHGAMDQAKSRSVPAYFRDSQGTPFLFVTGSSKQQEDSAVSIPPSLARVRIVTPKNQAPYLTIDQLEQTLVFKNPGSPVITSNGPNGAIVWVLDENAPRTASLSGPDAPRPVLYALDAMTFKPLWKSKPAELRTGGKYTEPAFAHGTVFVGTDRIQAFGLRQPGG